MLLTPTYHVFDMYQPFMEATPYPASACQDRNRCRATTTCRWWMCRPRAGKDGKLVLSIVNTDPGHAVQVVTNLTGTAHGRILTAFAMDAHNSFEHAQHGASAGVPEQHGGGKMVTSTCRPSPSRW